MTRIRFLKPDGGETVIDAKPGESVMLAALRNNVPGIAAECGGNCACATCHVYVDETDLARLSPPGEDELGMLDAVAALRMSGSRLACQIPVAPDLADLLFILPDRQF